MSNIFNVIKENLNLSQVVENAGIKINRSHMCVCPFHNDKNPSMKINEKKYYCFACLKSGDAVDFISEYYGLSLYDAAKKICSDFGLSYDEYDSNSPPVKIKPVKSDEQRYKEIETRCFNTLCDYYQLLRKWKKEYAPKTPMDEVHPLFEEALQNITKVEYALDTLLSGDISDRVFILNDYGKKVIELEKRIRDINKGAKQNSKRSVLDI